MTTFSPVSNAIHVIIRTTSNMNVAYPEGSDDKNHTLTVSYTHLTLPTTPYV